MKLDEYQLLARTTAIYPDDHRVTYPTLGMVGEAGEVANKVKKILRDRKGRISSQDEHEIASELGDVLWYVAMLAVDLKFNLSEIAEMNLAKLKSRAERGTLQGSGDAR